MNTDTLRRLSGVDLDRLSFLCCLLRLSVEEIGPILYRDFRELEALLALGGWNQDDPTIRRETERFRNQIAGLPCASRAMRPGESRDEWVDRCLARLRSEVLTRRVFCKRIDRFMDAEEEESTQILNDEIIRLLGTPV